MAQEPLGVGLGRGTHFRRERFGVGRGPRRHRRDLVVVGKALRDGAHDDLGERARAQYGNGLHGVVSSKVTGVVLIRPG